MSPSHSHTILGGICVDICQTINIFLQPAIQNMVQRIAIGMMGAEMKKDINNLSDYQCLTFNLGVFSLRKSGAAGNRTLVQTWNQYAFYMLSRLLIFEPGSGKGTQCRILSFKISP